MRILSTGLLLSLVVPVAAADLKQAQSTAPGPLAGSTTGRICQLVADSPATCAQLQDGMTPTDVARSRSGWIVAGRRTQRHDHAMFVASASDGGPVQLFPDLPPTSKRRGAPQILLDDGHLAGMAWLEGNSQDTLHVMASPWLGDAWGDVETVSSPGTGSQVGLDGVVLRDGSWLLAWSSFDGTDDEIVWSLRSLLDWSEPRRVHAANDVPDVTPSLIAVERGALVAWGAFDGRDYRVRLARFDGRSFGLPRQLEGRGGFDPRFFTSDSGIFLRYGSVTPREWTLLRLDPSGATDRLSRWPGHSYQVPIVEPRADGVAVRWQIDQSEPELFPWAADR